MSVSEIAKMAGVSVATVSRVLNNHPRVRPETVQQVRKVLQDLGYVRPTIRRGPRLGRRGGTRLGSIAVIGLGDKTHARFRFSVFAAALAGIVRAARELELNVLVDDVANVNELCPAVRNGDVDGALVFVPPEIDANSVGLETLRQRMPVVRMMGNLTSITSVDHVGSDNMAIGNLAFQFLWAKGCRELAFLSNDPTWDFNQTRAFGFLHAARQAGVVPTCYIVSSDPLDAEPFGSRVVRCETKEELAERLASASPRPTGVFVCRDTDAIRFQPLLQARGVRIGSDSAAEMRLVSCDNDEIRLSMLNPRPISIDLCPEEIGRRGMIRLAGRIRKPDEPSFRTLIVPRLTAGPGMHEQLRDVSLR
jgi:DNA-binding LacI/PurR family transcriptional regulator